MPILPPHVTIRERKNREKRYVYRYTVPVDLRLLFGRREIKFILDDRRTTALTQALIATDILEKLILEARKTKSDDQFLPSWMASENVASTGIALDNLLAMLAREVAPEDIPLLNLPSIKKRCDALNKITPPVPAITLKEALDRWIKFKTDIQRVGSGSVGKFETVRRELIWAFGPDLPITNLDGAKITKLSEAFALDLPPLVDRCNNNMTLDNMYLIDGKKLADATKHNALNIIKNFLKWLYKPGKLLPIDLSEDLMPVKFYLPQHTIDKMPDSLIVALYNAVLPYKADDKKMYDKTVDDLRWRFWVFLVLLYTGARVAEICQLHITDVLVKGDVDPLSKIKATVNRPCLVIAPTDGDEENAIEAKRVKNRASWRTIPIHPILIKLGFLDYVQSRSNENVKYPGQVFPLRHYKKNGSSHDATRFYGPLIRTERENDSQLTKVVFASTRHNVETQFTTKYGGNHHICERIVGHTALNPIQAAYVQPPTPEEMWKYLKIISYPCIEKLIK